MAEVGREGRGEVLPGEDAQAGGEAGRADGGEDRAPGVEEVSAAGVEEQAEGGVGCVRGEDVADELIAGDAGFGCGYGFEEIGGYVGVDGELV